MAVNKSIIPLTILAITDAYLISHPNLMGKIGVRMYNYDMIKTFPVALITVFATLGISYLATVFLEKQILKKWAKYCLMALFGISVLVLIQIYFKFSSGSYAHTGKAFIFGMHLLPILLIYIFGNGLWNWIKASKI
jgi:hypothetical protein